MDLWGGKETDGGALDGQGRRRLDEAVSFGENSLVLSIFVFFIA